MGNAIMITVEENQRLISIAYTALDEIQASVGGAAHIVAVRALREMDSIMGTNEKYNPVKQ